MRIWFRVETLKTEFNLLTYYSKNEQFEQIYSLDSVRICRETNDLTIKVKEHQKYLISCTRTKYDVPKI